MTIKKCYFVLSKDIIRDIKCDQLHKPFALIIITIKLIERKFHTSVVPSIRRNHTLVKARISGTFSYHIYMYFITVNKTAHLQIRTDEYIAYSTLYLLL